MTDKTAKLITYLSHTNIATKQFTKIKNILEEYDEMQSRSCGNCNNFNFLSSDCVIDCQYYGLIDFEHEVDNTFSCNKWEKKT